VFSTDCAREATELGGSTGTASDLLAAVPSGLPNNNKQNMDKLGLIATTQVKQTCSKVMMWGFLL
jgi:hypothetical protein